MSRLEKWNNWERVLDIQIQRAVPTSLLLTPASGLISEGNKMFYFGLGIGLFIGTLLGIFIIGIFSAEKAKLNDQI